MLLFTIIPGGTEGYVRTQLLLQFPVRLIFFGDFSRLRRDLSPHWREKSRFLPLYYSYCRVVREARGIPATHYWNIKHIHGAAAAALRRPPSPSAALHRHLPPPSSQIAAAVAKAAFCLLLPPPSPPLPLSTHRHCRPYRAIVANCRYHHSGLFAQQRRQWKRRRQRSAAVAVAAQWVTAAAMTAVVAAAAEAGRLQPWRQHSCGSAAAEWQRSNGSAGSGSAAAVVQRR